jgi:hypothetical protein
VPSGLSKLARRGAAYRLRESSASVGVDKGKGPIGEEAEPEGWRVRTLPLVQTWGICLGGAAADSRRFEAPGMVGLRSRPAQSEAVVKIRNLCAAGHSKHRRHRRRLGARQRRTRAPFPLEEGGGAVGPVPEGEPPGSDARGGHVSAGKELAGWMKLRHLYGRSARPGGARPGGAPTPVSAGG